MAQKLKTQPKNLKTWFFNKTQLAHRVAKPLAARASRWGGPSGVALVIFLLIGSFLYPKNEVQILKWRLLNNPNDFETHLTLAEKLLDNNQFEEAEKSLLLTQKLLTTNNKQQRTKNAVLGEKTNSKISELWQRKHYADPQDIKKLIALWEKIVVEKPNYRDGYLQLAILNYKIWQNEKARQYLNKALEIDHNFEEARNLKVFILQP